MSQAAASIRDRDWNPISSIAPSPPTIQSRFFCHPCASHLARTPIATAGAFSNSELVHATWYGLYGYVDVYTVLQPVEATIPMFSFPYTNPVAASIMRNAVASPHPIQDPAPPTYNRDRSASIMSASAFSLMNFFGVSGMLR